MIRRATAQDIGPWAGLRHALWDFESEDSLAFQAAEALSRGPNRYVAFLAFEGEAAVGFAEASLRTDYVNGSEHTPVAFLEGVYVLPDHRKTGLARALVTEVETWARGLDLLELDSDALLDNAESHAMHEALGFEETERVVYFRKDLSSPPDDPNRPPAPTPVARDG